MKAFIICGFVLGLVALTNATLPSLVDDLQSSDARYDTVQLFNVSMPPSELPVGHHVSVDLTYSQTIPPTASSHWATILLQSGRNG